VRRSTPDCSFLGREKDRLLGVLARLDARAVAAALEPHVTSERRERLASVISQRLDSVTVLMDAPHDPHNGAAVVRSCDAFGVQRLHVVERREGFLSSNTVSKGSERWVEVVTTRSGEAAVKRLRESGHELVATHPDGELVPSDLAKIPRVALVLGNEREGIDGELHSACARSVRIPMRGFAESLNVSVTGAILLEHATAGRPGDLDEEWKAKLYARGLVISVHHASEILAANGIDLLEGGL
jgi:tRNA (guanosine-2'-O-)-methyltransferase